jgi:hypothetical protein
MVLKKHNNESTFIFLNSALQIYFPSSLYTYTTILRNPVAQQPIPIKIDIGC